MNTKFDHMTKGLAQSGAHRQTLNEPGVGTPRPSLHPPSLDGPKRRGGKSILSGCGSASLCLALAGFLAASAGAQTYDAVADFSTNANPNGVWSYRYTIGSSRDGNYALLPGFDPTVGFNEIGSWGLDGYPPEVGVNLTGLPVAYQGSGFVWPADAMHVHPGPGGPVVVSWQSPFNMLVDIVFSFSDLNPGGTGPCSDGIGWFVESNDSTATLASGVVPNGGNSGPQALSRVSVRTGDRINFLVDPHGDWCGDSTQFAATITTVPGSIVGPALHISPSGGAVIVWWRTNAPDFVLETAPSLAAAQNWTRWSGPVLVIGDQNVVAADATSARRFFRLRKR